MAEKIAPFASDFLIEYWPFGAPVQTVGTGKVKGVDMQNKLIYTFNQWSISSTSCLNVWFLFQPSFVTTIHSDQLIDICPRTNKVIWKTTFES